MKILVALHQVMDLGGIINHTEQLIGGLKDLGHRVDLKQFVYAMNAHAQNRDGDFMVGPSGIPHNQGKGWNFNRMQRVPYKGGANLNSAIQILKGYDLVIWTVPVPSKNKENLGNHEWMNLYDLPKSVKQIAFVHDGNIRNGAPHILAIQEHLVGLACVHGCALNGADFITVPRALIVNPQENPVRNTLDWLVKRPGFVNMQTFKAWKHAHELIQAIAYMPKKKDDELREVAGMGIEYQYMTSEDKCKEEYFHGPSEEWFGHMRFWEAAELNGMTHHGYWNVDQVDQWLTRARILVDPSWSKKYSAIGGHWNRVVVDAMIRGAIPVATQLGMGTELFEVGRHYIAVEAGGNDPEAYANTILEASNMPWQRAREFRDNNRELLPMFDRKVVAQRVIDLANWNLPVMLGDHNEDIYKKASDLMFNHFGVLI